MSNICSFIERKLFHSEIMFFPNVEFELCCGFELEVLFFARVFLFSEIHHPQVTLASIIATLGANVFKR